jgi:hypothetical protein
MRKFSVFFVLFLKTLFGNEYYLLDGQYEDNSVIKIWYTVIGLLDQYEKGRNYGFSIEFDCNGRHYSKDREANWWDYYFAFHSIGIPNEAKVVRLPRYKRSTLRFETACTMTPERANYLINKYIHLQPELKAMVEQLKQDYWPKGIPLIGVYYQNPIMPEAQELWEPAKLAAYVKGVVKDRGDCKICIFTDLEEVRSTFLNEFNSQCIYIPLLVNHASTSPIERGEHELLTLLLLSQCDILIAPGCYQGIGAKFLNPQLNLIEIDIFPYALR